MLISVAIPAFNGAEYLRQAIDSVLAQTHQPIEVVVVDDGSTDHTRAVCESYRNSIRYIYQENDRTNGAGARAAGLHAARGEWVALLDQDDRWLPGKIEKQLAALPEMPDAGMIFTGFQPIDEAGQPVGEPVRTNPSGDVFHLLLSANPYCASSALIRREAIEEYGVPEPRPGPADYELWLHLGRNVKAAVVSDPLTEYRTHAENYSTDRTRLAGQVLELLDRQKVRLHPGCTECRASLRLGRKHFAELAADAYLNQYHDHAREGELGEASAMLFRALRISPSTVAKPRRAAAVIKNGFRGMGRGRRSPDRS